MGKKPTHKITNTKKRRGSNEILTSDGARCGDTAYFVRTVQREPEKQQHIHRTWTNISSTTHQYRETKQKTAATVLKANQKFHQRLPSGPAQMPFGLLPGEEVGYSCVRNKEHDRVCRCVLEQKCVVSMCVCVVFVSTCVCVIYTVIAPPVVIRPIFPTVYSVNLQNNISTSNRSRV